jgi:hypothetical protein
MDQLPKKLQEKLKAAYAKSPYEDENGKPRTLRELPGGNVALVSDEEFGDELSNQEKIKDKWPKNPKSIGKGELGEHIGGTGISEPTYKKSLIQ